MITIDNKIYVFVKEKNKGILKFPKFDIETTASRPTAGCIAVDKETMKKLIESINEYTKIEICKK